MGIEWWRGVIIPNTLPTDGTMYNRRTGKMIAYTVSEYRYQIFFFNPGANFLWLFSTWITLTFLYKISLSWTK